jgi:opacity protein-like surface antigen
MENYTVNVQQNNTVKLNRIIAGSTIMASAFAATAVQGFETETLGTIKPYVGAGMQVTRIASPNEGTNKLFKKNYPGVNAAVGLKIGEYFGVELGMQRQKTKNGAFTFTAGQNRPVFGVVPPDSQRGMISKFRMRSVDMNVLGYFPVLDCTQVFGSIGISHVTSSGYVRVTADEVGPLQDEPLINRSYKNSKNISLIRLGIQQDLANNFMIRAFGEWKQLHKLSLVAVTPTNAPSPSIPVRLKNAMSLGVGVLYSF